MSNCCTWLNPISSIYGNYANQSCMALALVRCSIEGNQGGTLHARTKVSLVSWDGESHVVLFMVPFGPPGARPIAQALRLPFRYYILYETNVAFAIISKKVLNQKLI